MGKRKTFHFHLSYKIPRFCHNKTSFTTTIYILQIPPNLQIFVCENWLSIILYVQRFSGGMALNSIISLLYYIKTIYLYPTICIMLLQTLKMEQIRSHCYILFVIFLRSIISRVRFFLFTHPIQEKKANIFFPWFRMFISFCSAIEWRRIIPIYFWQNVKNCTCFTNFRRSKVQGGM